jgi:transposase
MPRARAVLIELTAAERRILKQRDRGGKTPWQVLVRARIVRRAARGHPNERIARDLGVTTDTVRCWRGRFAAARLDGLAGLPRSGRPPQITAVQIAQVRALACQLPAETGVPLSRWSCPELAAELIRRQMLPAISASTVRRILAGDPIKPWQHQSWISIRDPGFTPKATRVLDLYQRRWNGAPLRDDEYVISSDAKPSIQARCRCHPTLPPGVARAMRVEHEYERKGALAYLAALDVHHAEVFGHCAPATGIVPFMTLAAKVMGQEPYASASRVFWIAGNGSDHRSQAAAKRLAKAHPNCIMVHTPVHASWLNQVECFFSIVQRKVLTPSDFTGLAQLKQRLLAFQDRYNATATPFKWKFTATDLAEVIAWIDRHEPTPPPPTPKKHPPPGRNPLPPRRPPDQPPKDFRAIPLSQRGALARVQGSAERWQCVLERRRCGVAAVLAGDHGGEFSQAWQRIGYAGAADQDEAACCRDVSRGAARARVHHVRDRQGHGEHVGAQAIVIESGAEGDAHAAGDDRGAVVIQPGAFVVGGIEHHDAKPARRAMQAGERGRRPGHACRCAGHGILFHGIRPSLTSRPSAAPPGL